MNLFGSLLVSVTIRPPAGAGAARDSEEKTCRSWPTVRGGTLRAGAVTVAVIDAKFEDALKPEGVTTCRSEVPGASGWNIVNCDSTPPPKLSGLVVIDP